METCINGLKENSLPWLLEEDNPGVVYLARRDLLDQPKDDPQMALAARRAHEQGPIAEVLAQMDPQGYWVKPGPGYGPKYRSTVWAVSLLGQLGADPTLDARLNQACLYLLENTLAKGGQFSMTEGPSGTLDCLQGNLVWALLAMGWWDERLEKAVDWMARSVTGEGIAPNSDRQAEDRYYAYHCGPGFACGGNWKQACAWGATKVMLALGRLAPQQRTPAVQRAIQAGVEFFFSANPAEATYPSGNNAQPSRNWWKFGFPVFYVTDLLQVVEALVQLGYARDPRLKPALDLILSKQNAQGRWALEYDYAGKTWGDYGPTGQPNKWVTLRVLRVLKTAHLE